MPHILEIADLHKSFGRGSRTVHANDGVDLTVKPGQIVGLLGHNGAGKSTLVNQIVGLLLPDSGSITLVGVDAIAHPEKARRLASVQAQANVPITGLTPLKATELVGRIRGGDPRAVKKRAAKLIDALDLGQWANTPAEKVSGGIARLTAFAMAAVVPGQLLVLDEPTNDVDPVRRRMLWHQIQAVAAEGTAVLLVTHNVREAERVVDHLAILDHGVVLAADTPAALTQSRNSTLTLDIDVCPGATVEWLSGLDPAQRGVGHFTTPLSSARAAEVVGWAEHERDAGRVERFSLTPASLEDVYIDLVTPVQEAA